MLSARMPRRQTAQEASIPAPVGGMNAVDAGSSSGPLDCLYAYNLIPCELGLGSRMGYQEHHTNFSEAVRSVVSFKGSEKSGTTDKLWAVDTSGIWTATDASDSLNLEQSFASSAGEAGYATSVVMSTTAGRFVLCCDEANGLHIYTETSEAWAAATAGVTQAWAGSTAYIVGNQVVSNSKVYTCTVAGTSHASVGPSHSSGTAADGTATWQYVSASSSTAIGPSLADQVLGYSFDPTAMVAVTVWKNRVWLVERNTSRAWYLGINSIYGTATSFDFGPKMRAGGSLINLFNWSYDGGSGLDTLLVGLSSGGDVVIYQGTDPSSISTFSIKGCWSAGGFVSGRKVATDYGGDLALLSTLGLIPLSTLVRGGSAVDEKLHLSRKIAPVWTRLATTYVRNHGWSVFLHPSENCLVVTVPSIGEGQATTQLCMSLSTGGWFLWRDMPVYSACVWAGEMYFGTTDGRVCVHRGFVDNILLSEISNPVTFSAVGWSVLTPFRNMGSMRNKQVKLIRPVVLSGTGSPLTEAHARYDYNLLEPTAPSGTAGSGSGTWGEGVWDTTTWGADYASFSPMRGGAGMGRDVAIAVRGSAISRTVLAEIGVAFEVGGQLG